MKKQLVLIATLILVQNTAYSGVHGGGALPPEARSVIQSLVDFRRLNDHSFNHVSFEFRGRNGEVLLRDVQTELDYLHKVDNLEVPSKERRVSKVVFDDGSELEFLNEELTNPSDSDVFYLD